MLISRIDLLFVQRWPLAENGTAQVLGRLFSYKVPKDQLPHTFSPSTSPLPLQTKVVAPPFWPSINE